MSTKFITSIYSDLYGTEFGGRPNREGHYRYSLLSLLKITDADFLCYTSDRELPSLESFFYEEHLISKDKLKFKVFDIANTKFKDLINQHKNVEATKKGDRCIEVQYSKFHWWRNEDKSYDYYYWIDAGLSHCGLIPLKYLNNPNNHPQQRYYESNLFNNDFLKNVIEDTGDNFLIIGKENDRNYWSATVDSKWYTKYDRSIHVIGGMFGGHRDKWDEIVNLFEDYVEKIISEDKSIPHEENVMTLMYFNHLDLFERKDFDIWWCRDNGPAGAPDELYQNNKSFYKILEEFNRINE
tara:strand:- start:2389 stop:3276 length:888 start_codon:yes stop_codon:yes gene_type:complete